MSPKPLTKVCVVAGHVPLRAPAGDFDALDALRVPAWIRSHVGIADLQRRDDTNLRAHLPL